jgi:hypothetical protein
VGRITSAWLIVDLRKSVPENIILRNILFDIKTYYKKDNE